MPPDDGEFGVTGVKDIGDDIWFGTQDRDLGDTYNQCATVIGEEAWILSAEDLTEEQCRIAFEAVTVYPDEMPDVS